MNKVLKSFEKDQKFSHNERTLFYVHNNINNVGRKDE